MRDKEIAIAAIKQEAMSKPDEKIVAGRVILTYKELCQKIDNGDKTIYKLFVEPYIRMLRESKEFKAKVMEMLGV